MPLIVIGSTCTTPPIQFYVAEVGIDLIFNLKTLSLDGCTLDTLTIAPLPTYPKLHVEGSVGTPFVLAPTGTPGQYKHVVGAGQFPVGADEVMHRFECYIEWRDSIRILLSDAFEITAIKAPSTSLE